MIIVNYLPNVQKTSGSQISWGLSLQPQLIAGTKLETASHTQAHNVTEGLERGRKYEDLCSSPQKTPSLKNLKESQEN